MEKQVFKILFHQRLPLLHCLESEDEKKREKKNRKKRKATKKAFLTSFFCLFVPLCFPFPYIFISPVKKERDCCSLLVFM